MLNVDDGLADRVIDMDDPLLHMRRDTNLAGRNFLFADDRSLLHDGDD